MNELKEPQIATIKDAGVSAPRRSTLCPGRSGGYCRLARGVCDPRQGMPTGEWRWGALGDALPRGRHKNAVCFSAPFMKGQK